jgi:hypothetical protein
VHKVDLVVVEQLAVAVVQLEQIQHRLVGNHSGILEQVVAMAPAAVPEVLVY